MRRGLAAGVAAATVAACCAPAPALALEPGVHVNPGSPSGTEYAVPLDEARGNAASGSSGGGGDSGQAGGGAATRGAGGSAAPAPLFGVGVAAAARPRHRGTSHGSRRGAGASTPGAPANATLPAIDAGSSSALPVVAAGLAGLVLLAGVALGVILRRRNSARG